MSYVDGFVIPVPKKNLKAYRQMAKLGAKLWKKYGALEYFECIGDNLRPKGAAFNFSRTVRAKQGETVVFSFVVYKSRAHRDRVIAKVMADPAMNDPKYAPKSMPFNLKRMAWGGFKVLVEA